MNHTSPLADIREDEIKSPFRALSRHSAEVENCSTPKLFTGTFGEHYENIDSVSKERKPACPEQRHSRKTRHPGPYMNVTDQKNPFSTASSTGTTPSLFLTWRNKAGLYPTMYKKNLMNI